MTTLTETLLNDPQVKGFKQIRHACNGMTVGVSRDGRIALMFVDTMTKTIRILEVPATIAELARTQIGRAVDMLDQQNAEAQKG